VNSLCNKLSSPGSNIVISNSNHKNTSFIYVFSGFIFTQGTAISRESGHNLQCKVWKKNCLGTICAACISQRHFILAEKTCLDRLAVPGLSTVVWHPIQLHKMKNAYRVSHPLRRPSFLIPTNILQNANKLTNIKTYSNPVRHFLTFRYISWQVITRKNQRVFRRRHILSPWLYKWKCFWWRTQKHQTSKLFSNL
jgi:hypothetical protein